MIAKDTTTTVNFFVTDTDGLPSTGQASNITATLSIDGGTATAISDTITEKGAGWYYFNHSFTTAGNAFITFTAANCVIMPWEEEVVEISASSAPSAADIADAVWDEIVFGRSPMVTDSAADILITAAATGTPSSIWNYANRSLTSEVLTRDENYQPIKTLAISSEITTAKDAILTRGNSAWITATGFSTFNPATDTVIINTTQAATMVTATGFATPSDLAGLSTFNPSTDTVTINATQAATMVTATGFATPSDLSGLSTFNAATDKVTLNTTEDTTLSAIKTKVDTLNNTDLTGIATSANITTAQNAIINAMPDISGLSTFDAANDTVTINATQAATMVTATGFATPSDIPTSDISAIKTKVDSLHNTDLTGIATSTNITTAQTAIISHGDENWTGGGSGGGATAQQIWEYPNRTITAATLPNNASIATAADITAATTTIENYGSQHWETATGFSTFNPATDTVLIDSTQAASMATATGFATPADITDSQADIIAAVNSIDTSGLATSTEVAVLADLQKDLNAGVLNWSVTANALTIYNDNNSIRATYTLTRDAEGNITRIQPNS